jgi:hypothetical protein
MKQLAAITAAVGLVLLAACAGPASQSPGGTVTGRLLLEGGTSRFNGLRPISGTVQFTGPHQLATIRVGNSGTFSVVLPAGIYHVSGRSPHVIEVSNGTNRQVPCTQPLSVTVTPAHPTKITLACIVP